MPAFSCVIIGHESLLVQCAEMAMQRDNRVLAIVTRSPDIAQWARAQGVQVLAPGGDLAAHLSDLRFDWLLSIANLDMIPAQVLAMPRKGAVNFHDGPLPRHAGVNAPVWALIEGEVQHGISWHLIQNGVDEGDVLVQRNFDIGAQDTALSLNTRCYEAAMGSFPALLDQLETRITPKPQDLSVRSYHPRDARPSGHGLLDFSRPAGELERLVRALDHGAYWNPLCCPKLSARGQVWVVGQATLTPSTATPGTVLEVTGDSLTVACGAQALVLRGVRDFQGAQVAPDQIAAPGDLLDLDEAEDLDITLDQLARDDAMMRRALRNLSPAALHGVSPSQGPADIRCLPLSGAFSMEQIAQWAQQLTGRDRVDLAYSDAQIAMLAQTGLVSDWVPVRAEELARDCATMAGRSFALDLPLRAPELQVPTRPVIGIAPDQHVSGTAITVQTDTGTFSFDAAQVDPQLAALWSARLSGGTLPDTERDLVLNHWNQTQSAYDADQTMQSAFEAQVARTPDAIALIFEDQQITYAELNQRANRAAHVLRDMGVGRDQLVGLCLRRSVDLMVGALAILKAGGAYLPMDPTYPADRLAHFISDSQTPVVVTHADQVLPDHSAQLLMLDADPRLAQAPSDNPDPVSGTQDLAYVIYTSGSTGKPKGVMIEHRNVMNFYHGMDAHIPHDSGTWLAVTSLSFDISVLELFWTTARGLTVVLAAESDRAPLSNGAGRVQGDMGFSLYYWGNDDGVGRDKYQLLLEGAQFADQNGFCAVWTPERHFHAFGGPYPNPSVTGAAVAAVTRNIAVRSGSVVAPLHHPARIAEEWAVIDNLTNGRAGLALASGWQPDDFVLRPENTPPANKDALLQSLDQIRKLWRGEAVGFARQDGSLHDVVTQPRPVSPELPIWLTIAGNPDTWREAGLQGCHVLTHLLGQSIEELAEKIQIYHRALREAGHNPRDFQVALMLHTFVAATRDQARDTARGPMKDYLSSAAGLIKQYAWAFPAFKRPEGVNNAFDLQLDELDGDEVDAILDFAFERYFNDSGLFGSVEDALARVDQLRAIGVSEVACLIDYGIARDTVLEGLKPLAQVVAASAQDSTPEPEDFSLVAQIQRHGVSHLQCTPSMARMFAMNDEARQALVNVQHLYFGGEALPGDLVRDYASFTTASTTNMYGPTETTIWSACTPAQPGSGTVSLGLPLANQQLYVLDDAQNPVGVGVEGELWIGGDGVTRGYWQREDLTTERFRPNPFGTGRIYRTGDLVRREISGQISFIGRVDHQIKLRGFRIELGEIESQLQTLPGITQAVVTAREASDGDLRLVGYYTGTAQSEAALKEALAQGLPAYMVPGRMVHLAKFPLTPNQKIDRSALPDPAQTRAAPKPVAPAPVGQASADTLAALVQIWREVLGQSEISARDNFFDLGGHSLLAVQVHRAIRDQIGVKGLTITDIFRFPVLGQLAARVSELGGGTPLPPATAPLSDRAATRAEAMARRRAMRAGRQ